MKPLPTQMPANLVQRCDDVPSVVKVITVADLIRHDTLLTNLYGECAKSKDALIEALNQFK